MDVFEKLLDLAETGCPAEIVTLVAAPVGYIDAVGQVLALPVGEEAVGILVDACFTARVIAELQGRPWEKPGLFSVDSASDYLLFRDRLEPPRAALVLGAGHISQPLVEMLALTGYAVTVVDDRPDFANAGRFPRADSVVCGDFQQVSANLDGTEFAAIVVVTRGHRSDLDCLRVLLQRRLGGYLGMVGSRRRVRLVMEVLVAEGFDASRLGEIRAPIGIDIGAQTPAEIAVSILAEIIGTKTKAGFQALSTGRRGFHG